VGNNDLRPVAIKTVLVNGGRRVRNKFAGL
jgi:hypothetical protein